MAMARHNVLTALGKPAATTLDRWTPGRLAAAIASAGGYREGAALIGSRLATEDGVGQAVAEIERRLRVQ